MNKAFCQRADATAARHARRSVASNKDDPRDLGVRSIKGASQKPFDGDPYTRLAGAV